VCTIGPASNNKEMISKLVEAGANVFRLNMAHASHQFVSDFLVNLREFIKEENSTAEVGVWIDINGPKIRTGKLANGEKVWIESGKEFFFCQ
jgi:pyruvate kinase